MSDDPHLLYQRLEAASRLILLVAQYADLEASLEAAPSRRERKAIRRRMGDVKRAAEAAGERLLQLDAAAQLGATGRA